MTTQPVVSYECRTPSEEMPKLCKVLTVGDTVIDTAITPDNAPEFALVSDELILEHINNLVNYMQAKMPLLAITPISQSPTDTWPLTGFKDVVEAGMLLDKWWWAAHTREEAEEEDPEP